MAIKLLSAGDNSGDRLLHPSLSASATFVESTPTTFTPSDIAQIAGGKELGVLCKNGALYVSGEGFRKLDYALLSIFVAPNCLFGIDNNHVARNLNSGAELFHSEYAVCFAASSTIRAIIIRNRRCIAAFPTVTIKVTDGAIAIGCTSSAVYAATAESLVECRVDTSKVVAVPEPMVAMLCSDDDGYFIGKSGKLYKQFEESFVPINGLRRL
jgi:hypothetical protein